MQGTDLRPFRLRSFHGRGSGQSDGEGGGDREEAELDARDRLQREDLGAIHGHREGVPQQWSSGEGTLVWIEWLAPSSDS